MEPTKSELALPTSSEMTSWQRSLLSNLGHKRTILTLCQYYQRHAPAEEIDFVALMNELLEIYPEEIADLSRLLRLYDVPPSEAEVLRHQVRDGRNRRTTLTRLEFLLSLTRANASWYQREVQREPPPDITALWTALLAADNERIQRFGGLLNPESSPT